jgi:CheY-like chemotaxis protein
MKRRILLADDSVTIQKVIELTFMDEDYEVRAVSNGDEALALLPEVNPDFVIADVHMPGANGYEVCRRSKQLRPDVPVLLLVGTFEPFDEAQTRAVGADSFLKKPFDSQELLQRVQDLLAAKAPAAMSAMPAAAVPDFSASPTLDMPPLSMPDMDLPPLAGSAGPEFSAEPSWGSFSLESEPEPAPQPFAAPAPEPFDREPSFSLEPDPSYSLESEPVFSLEESEPPFAAPDEVFAAPSELSLDETPQDRYIPDAPSFPDVPAAPFAATAPTAVTGFDWASASAPVVEPEPVFEMSAPDSLDEPEPLRFEEEPATPTWQEPVAAPAWEAPAAEPVAPVWAAAESTSIYAPAFTQPEPAAALEPEIASEPAFPPGPTFAPEPAFPPGPTFAPEPAFPPGPTVSEPAPVEQAAYAPAASNGNGRLSDEDVDRIAHRIVELMGDKAVRDVAWEVIPDMAEVIIRDRLRELESQVE